MKREGQTLVRVVSMVAWLSLLLVAQADVMNTQMSLHDLSTAQRDLWWLLFGCFGLALWLSTSPGLSVLSRQGWSLILAACACGATLLFSQGGNMVGLVLISAGAASAVLKPQWILGLVVVQSATLYLALAQDLGAAAAVFLTFSFALFQGFVAMVVLASDREFLARQALAESHLQLRLTQAMLEEAVRGAERARIARELHDNLGHQLTILGLDLQLAAHLSPSAEQQEAISRAYSLNRQLMVSLRESVETLRLYDWEDLHRIRTAVTASNPELQVNLSLPELAQELPHDITHLCLRLFQESVTNTIKYAKAQQFWYQVVIQDQHLMVQIWDSGRLRLPLTRGRGLQGLHERTRALGGTFEAGVRHDGAVHLQARLPLHRSPHLSLDVK